MIETTSTTVETPPAEDVSAAAVWLDAPDKRTTETTMSAPLSSGMKDEPKAEEFKAFIAATPSPEKARETATVSSAWTNPNIGRRNAIRNALMGNEKITDCMLNKQIMSHTVT